MHQVALELGPLTIHWYGVLTALGFVVGLWTASRRALRANVSPEIIADLGVWLIVGTVVGARTMYVISYWDDSFAGRPLMNIFKIWEGGLVFYGGLVGASLACVLFARIKKQTLWQLADIMAPSIPLGHAFGRIGCLMNGCCYGKECDLPWAIHFPSDHITNGAGVHPTQLYEFTLNLCLYAGLVCLFRRRHVTGQVFASYLMGYAILRSIIEVFRGDYANHYTGLLSPGQLVSIFIFVAGAVLYGWVTRSSLNGKQD